MGILGRRGRVLSFAATITFAVFVAAIATISDRSGGSAAKAKRVKSSPGTDDLAEDSGRTRTQSPISETTSTPEGTRDSDAESERRPSKPSLTEAQAWSLRTGGLYNPARDVGKVWHSWPEKETKVEPPKERGEAEKSDETQGSSGGTLASKGKLGGTSSTENPRSEEGQVVPEPPAPTPQRIREVSSWPEGSEDTLSQITVLLGDPSQPSALKLIAIEKLRAYPAERVVPILMAFLTTPSPAGGAYTKPSAVKVLFDLGATDSLASIAAGTTDSRVKLAIASLTR